MELNLYAKLPERRDWRVGCVGAGFIMAECHIPNYQKAGYVLDSICSAGNSAAQVAERYGFPHCYDSLNELLDDPELNAHLVDQVSRDIANSAYQFQV